MSPSKPSKKWSLKTRGSQEPKTMVSQLEILEVISINIQGTAVPMKRPAPPGDKGQRAVGWETRSVVAFLSFFLGYRKWYGSEVLDFESRCWDMVSIQWLSLNFSIEIKLQIKVCGFLSDFHWIAEFSWEIAEISPRFPHLPRRHQLEWKDRKWRVLGRHPQQLPPRCQRIIQWRHLEAGGGDDGTWEHPESLCSCAKLCL